MSLAVNGPWLAISFCPIFYYLGEETNSHLLPTPFQAALESNKDLDTPFLQTEHPQLPQLLLIRLVLQILRPSLDMLQDLNVFLVVRGRSSGSSS